MLKDYLNETVEPALIFAPLCALLGDWPIKKNEFVLTMV